MKIKFIFITPMIVFLLNTTSAQNSFGENATDLYFNQVEVEELLISQINTEGKLDTFDFLKIIDGSDKVHSFVDQNGNEVNYLTFRNKVVLVDFWFLKCAPCIVELPALDLLNKRIKSEEFEIITFANDPIQEIEEKLLSKKQFNFKIIPQVFLVSMKIYPLKMLVNKKSEIVDLVTYGNTSQRSIDLLLDKYTSMIKKEIKRN